jgi:hypothetical protein
MAAAGEGVLGQSGVVVGWWGCGKTGCTGDGGELGAENGGGAVFLAEVGERDLFDDVSF